MLSSENVIIMENTTSEGQDLMMKKIPRHSSKIFKVLILCSSKNIYFQFTHKLQKKMVSFKRIQLTFHVFGSGSFCGC